MYFQNKMENRDNAGDLFDIKMAYAAKLKAKKVQGKNL